MEYETPSKGESETPSKKKKVDIARCSSEKDMITFIEWTESEPEIFINFLPEEEGKIGTLHCYDADSLSQWAKNKENVFARWVGLDIDEIGFGGHPDLDDTYLRLYPYGEYVKMDENVRDIQKGIRNAYYNAKPLEIIRLGNLQGRFGQSEVHGQAPGYRVYQLELTDLLEPETGKKDEFQRDLEEIDPDLFGHGYARQCQKRSRPIVVPIDSVEKYIAKHGEEGVLEYPKESSVFYACESDKDGSRRYPGLRPNRSKDANYRNKHKFLPCCFSSSHTAKKYR